MAAVKLTDGGHLAKMADGRIVRFSPTGQPIETLRPGDDRYGFWLGLLYPTRTTPRTTSRVKKRDDDRPNPIWSQQLGANMAKAREVAGLSKADLAKKMGVGWALVNHWEASEVEPDARSLFAFGESSVAGSMNYGPMCEVRALRHLPSRGFPLRLTLYGRGFTDVALEQLAKKGSVWELKLIDTGITEQALAEFKKTRPIMKCEVLP